MIVLALFNFQTYEGFKHVRGADLWVCLLVCVGVLACDGKEAKTCGSAFGWGTRTPCAMGPSVRATPLPPPKTVRHDITPVCTFVCGRVFSSLTHTHRHTIHTHTHSIKSHLRRLENKQQIFKYKTISTSPYECDAKAQYK